MDLSIIIPIYQVEKYVRQCLESIFRQGLADAHFEVIIVNDGTKDRSMEVIADIVQAHSNVTIINQENQGLSIARNNGMNVATGKYLMFVDSDDMLISQSVPYLLEKALSAGADMVIADFLKMRDDEINEFRQKPFQQKDGAIDMKTGRDMLALPIYSGYSCVWHTLYCREFLNGHNLRFIPHINYEDTPFTLQCYSIAKKCLKVNWLLNIYRINQDSITMSSFTKEKAMDYAVVIASTWKLSREVLEDRELSLKLQDDAYSFFKVLIHVVSRQPDIRSNDVKHILRYLKQLVPNLSFQHGMKQRITSFLYREMTDFYIFLQFFRSKYSAPVA